MPQNFNFDPPQFDPTEQFVGALADIVRPQNMLNAVHGLPVPLAMGTRAVVRKPSFSAIERMAESWTNNNVNYGAQLAQQLEADSSVTDTAMAYVTASLYSAASIDFLKKQTIGQNATTAASNLLIGKMLELTALSLAIDDFGLKLARDKTFATRLHDIAQMVLQQENLKVAWFAPKIRILSSHLNGFQALRRTIDALDRKKETSATGAETLKQENDELFVATAVFQKYGVKPAVAPSRLQKAEVREWLVTSEQQEMVALKEQSASTNTENAVGTARLLPHYVAGFIATDQRFASSEIKYRTLSGKSQKVQIMGIEMKGMIEPVDVDRQEPGMVMKLGTDGELYTQYGQSIRNLVNNPQTYETIRADILSIYADLVVPVYVQRMFDPVTQPERSGDGSGSNFDKMRRLVLARHRVITTNKDEIIRVLDDEQNETHTTHRDMVRHPVIGHVRDLPPTYRASMEARLLCKKDLGIDLPEFGATYVKDHHRGNLENNGKGHKAVRKRSAQAVINASNGHPLT